MVTNCNKETVVWRFHCRHCVFTAAGTRRAFQAGGPPSGTTLQAWVANEALALDLHPELDEGEVVVATGREAAGPHGKGRTGVDAQLVGPEYGVLSDLDSALGNVAG
jgi:hypothetical protein